MEFKKYMHVEKGKGLWIGSSFIEFQGFWLRLVALNTFFSFRFIIVDEDILFHFGLTLFNTNIFDIYIDFKTLNYFCLNKVKELKPEIFN